MKSKLITSMIIGTVLVSGLVFSGCDDGSNSTDSTQAAQTAQIQANASKKLGMPKITNFYEKGILKNILEQCDNSNLITYTYTKNEMTGKYEFLGDSIGYGIPYGTEYTNPSYIAESSSYGIATLPQPDPNGLYKAENVSATWVMLISPTTKVAKPVYIEDPITVVQDKLPRQVCDLTSLPSDY